MENATFVAHPEIHATKKEAQTNSQNVAEQQYLNLAERKKDTKDGNVRTDFASIESIFVTIKTTVMTILMRLKAVNSIQTQLAFHGMVFTMRRLL